VPDRPASPAAPPPTLLADLSGSSLLAARSADVGATREVRRRHRWVVLALLVWAGVGLAWWRVLTARGDAFGLPTVDWLILTPVMFFGLLLVLIVAVHVGAGRSPHVTYRPEQIPISLDDVKGIDPVKEDVVRSLNLFLAHKTFAAEMGGTPRRGLLFEGAPGTGKTHLARAMAAEAGVPFLFVSATSFQSMFYGATARKIRSYFKELRRTAAREGGAIGFIEEIDAIATSRGGLSSAPAPSLAADVGPMCCGTAALPTVHAAGAPAAAAGRVTHSAVSEGTGGVVNELLVQMQSFDAPSGGQRLATWAVDKVNLYLSPERQLRRPTPPTNNILLIAATNRADSLDPALLRPGRFDRRLTFELPAKAARRELIDHFLARKSHEPELAGSERRDALAGVTQGYTPVMIEHLLDEALVNALRRGADGMSWRDLETARLTEEVGLGQPVAYTDHERRLIATHEAGHATVAWLTAPNRRLEVLTVIKRRGALGLFAHGDREDVYTRSRREMLAMVQIALGGQVAEELFFDDISTGPSGDLLYATNVAAQMVGACGMTGTLISFAAVQNGAFNDSNLVGRVLGDPQGRSTVEDLLQEQRLRVRGMLDSSRHLVEALRDALLEHDELVGPEITAVLETAQRRAGPVLDVRTDPERARDLIGGATAGG
jgi:cell division protease FtsH